MRTAEVSLGVAGFGAVGLPAGQMMGSPPTRPARACALRLTRILLLPKELGDDVNKFLVAVNKIGVGVNKSFVEVNKTCVEGNKLCVDGNKTCVDGNKLCVELNKLFDGVNKLCVELNKTSDGGNKLCVELNKLLDGVNKTFVAVNKFFVETKVAWFCKATNFGTKTLKTRLWA